MSGSTFKKTSALLLATLAIAPFPASASAVPAVTTKDAADVTATTATLKGQVPAATTATTYWFEYGTTAGSYTQTPAATVGPAKNVTLVRYSLTGLNADTTYHFRLVADPSTGRSYGEDLTFVTASSTAAPGDPTGPTGPSGPTGSDGSFTDPIGDVTPDSGAALGSDNSKAPAPVLGETLGAGPASGSISVRVPGAPAFVPLAGGAAIPTGSTVDARRGAVRIVTAVGDAGDTQAATFHGAKFKVVQRTRGGGLTDIFLRGGDFSACNSAGARNRVTAAGKRSRIRRLWGRDHHGQFRTHGRGSIASVRGTVWVTVDRCDGTLTRVKRGAVSVRDLGRHRSVRLRAGEHYLAPRAR
jgi:hypothetical protein